MIHSGWRAGCLWSLYGKQRFRDDQPLSCELSPSTRFSISIVSAVWYILASSPRSGNSCSKSEEEIRCRWVSGEIPQIVTKNVWCFLRARIRGLWMMYGYENRWFNVYGVLCLNIQLSLNDFLNVPDQSRSKGAQVLQVRRLKKDRAWSFILMIWKALFWISMMSF